MAAPRRIRAAFYRGGTSKAVMFNARDLPADRATRDRIFVAALGSPDPYGRQLNGMGGGLSSLSKAIVLEPSSHPGAEVDYTFIQVAVDAPVADYGSMCGNMSAAVGPFALAEGLARAEGGEAVVRIRNTNTNKLFTARFPARDGLADETGDFTIPGVADPGACVRLDFDDPGGATTGHLLPTGAARDVLDVPGVGRIEASMVDASNPVVFVRAADLGADATRGPAELDADADLMARLDAIRRAGAVAMGLAQTPETAKLSNPKVAMVAPALPFTALDGTAHAAAEADVTIRIVSMGNTHRAVTLTGAMCVAVAARITGTLVAEAAGDGAPLRVANPSGVLPVMADVTQTGDGWHARSATTFRTQRCLMEGNVLVPAAVFDAP